MNEKYKALQSAIEAFGARFSAVNPEKSPIPVEISLSDVVKEFRTRLKQGYPIHPPREVMKGQDFGGYELMVTQPVMPGQNPASGALALSVSIHTDLTAKTVLTDQRIIAHGIIGIVIAEWLVEVEAEEKKKQEAIAAATAEKPEDAENKVVDFPAPQAEPKA